MATDDLAAFLVCGRDADGWLLRVGRVAVHWHAPSGCLWFGLKDGWGVVLGVRRW